MKQKRFLLIFMAVFTFLMTTSMTSFSQTTSTPPAPSGVLSLDAQATTEVPANVVHITLFYEKESQDPSALAAELSKVTEAALKEAKAQSKVNVSTNAFNVYPSTDRDGRISAWRGRTEIYLQSTDFTAASHLAGQLGKTLQVSNVNFSLSSEKQREFQKKLTVQAINAFKEQATDATKAFGYSSYKVREVNVGRQDIYARPRMMMMSAGAPKSATNESLPIEGGKTTVTVTVNGSIQMTQ